MNYREMFQVKPGSKVDLSEIDPDFTDGHHDESSAEKKTRKHAERLRELQYHLYAEGKWSLLICLQGLDSAGKDGTIVHVLGTMDPLGTRVCCFKVPTQEELAHDFLWRVEKRVPAKGEVVIFNRSHYEDVLVTRVHGTVPEHIWSERYEIINCFEKGLAAQGTRILKFLLHISPEEQLERFKQRLEDPLRQWKISELDYTERKYWKDYIRAYEEALTKTSTDCAPWYIIPSDRKWFRNLAVSKIVVEELESLGMKLPEPTVDLHEILHKYHRAEKEADLGRK
jgi:PPK2 family polyphosphate:nucleotide phosphotransferase